MHLRTIAILLSLCALACNAAAVQPWVQRSNENALYYLKILARFVPEGAARQGLAEYDEQIIDLKPGLYERGRANASAALAELEKRRAAEKDPLVQQDLDIIVKDTKDGLHAVEVRHNKLLPYFNANEIVFSGIQGLLDDQVAAGRRTAALVRLKRYAGMEDGYTPIVTLAEDRMRERMSTPGLLGPARLEVEKDLANAPIYIAGIGQLFAKYKIAGYEEPY